MLDLLSQSGSKVESSVPPQLFKSAKTRNQGSASLLIKCRIDNYSSFLVSIMTIVQFFMS